MFKHMTDDGDLAGVINDEGEAILVCTKCKRRWIRSLGASEPHGPFIIRRVPSSWRGPGDTGLERRGEPAVYQPPPSIEEEEEAAEARRRSLLDEAEDRYPGLFP
jgi:hypothetical protein